MRKHIHHSSALLQEKGPELIQSRGMSKWGVPNLPSDSYPSSADSLTTIPVPGQPFYPAASNLQVLTFSS